MKILGFDIEISNVFDLRLGEDIQKYAPFDVAVAATQISGGEHRLWFSPGANDKPSINMLQHDACELLNYLEQMQRDGFAVCAWNGLSFDLQWIARAADDVPTASRIARAMYDPMFQSGRVHLDAPFNPIHAPCTITLRRRASRVRGCPASWEREGRQRHIGERSTSANPAAFSPIHA